MSPPAQPTQPTQMNTPKQRYQRPAGSKFFEKYLVLNRTDNPNAKIPPIVRNKALEAVISQDAKDFTCTALRRGYLIEVNKEAHSTRLLNLKELPSADPAKPYPVSVVAHNTLNYVKGVLRDRFGELDEENPADLQKELESQGVVEINRTKFTPPDGGPKKPGRTYFLTFLTPKVPEKVRIGAEQFNIQKYTPRPQHCSKCLRYGHIAKFCRAQTPRCSHCAEAHEEAECDAKVAPPKCPDCGEGHRGGTTSCYFYKKESKIVEVMHDSHLLSWDARSEVEKAFPPRQTGPTQAQVAAAAQAKAEAEKEATTAKAINALQTQVGNLEAIIRGCKEDIVRLTQENAALNAKLQSKDKELLSKTEELKAANFKLTMTETELSLQEHLPVEPAATKKTPPVQKNRPAKKTGGGSRLTSHGSVSSIGSQPEDGHVTAMTAQLLKAEAQKRKLSRSPGAEPGTTLSLPKKQHATPSDDYQKPRQTARPEPSYGLHTAPLLDDNRFKELSREESGKGLIHKNV